MASDDLPDLDHGIVEDDELLWDKIEEVLVSDSELQRLQRWIADWQIVLRACADEEGWAVYLLVEQLANERAENSLMTMARWAFAEGVKIGGRQ